ncbi:MAG: hypothetical protein OXF43_06480, partial [Gammaproteobacteria bacterium]|nr:hypothetical protein [Gammaproteobacteria bacterium]MCY4182518.1 hypothetical protein [Gammaproteobacteria bacterium]
GFMPLSESRVEWYFRKSNAKETGYRLDNDRCLCPWFTAHRHRAKRIDVINPPRGSAASI